MAFTVLERLRITALSFKNFYSPIVCMHLLADRVCSVVLLPVIWANASFIFFLQVIVARRVIHKFCQNIRIATAIIILFTVNIRLDVNYDIWQLFCLFTLSVEDRIFFSFRMKWTFSFFTILLHDVPFTETKLFSNNFYLEEINWFPLGLTWNNNTAKITLQQF
jgi:hypothetical protein